MPSERPEWLQFQDLVASIEKHLAGKDARVVSPDRVADRRTGQSRDVDATVRLKVGDKDILIAIEYRDRTAVPDVTWIEQLIGKPYASGGPFNYPQRVIEQSDTRTGAICILDRRRSASWTAVSLHIGLNAQKPVMGMILCVQAIVTHTITTARVNPWHTEAYVNQARSQPTSGVRRKSRPRPWLGRARASR